MPHCSFSTALILIGEICDQWMCGKFHNRLFHQFTANKDAYGLISIIHYKVMPVIDNIIHKLYWHNQLVQFGLPM